jgi:hypothetical protein
MSVPEQNYLMGAEDQLHISLISIDMVGGDIVTGLMLDRLRFWFKPNQNGKPKTTINRDGKRWVAKTRKEWHDECRLTERQADRATAKLVELGLVETKVWKFKGNPTLHYWINPARCNELYTQLVAVFQDQADAELAAGDDPIEEDRPQGVDPNPAPVIPKSPNPQNGNPPSVIPFSPNGDNQKQESLQEILQDQLQDSPPPTPAIPQPNGGGGGATHHPPQQSDQSPKPKASRTGSGSGVKLAPPPDPTPPDDPALIPVYEMFVREQFGLWTTEIASSAARVVEEFGAEKLIGFMQDAVWNDKRKWSYVLGIMRKRRRGSHPVGAGGDLDKYSGWDELEPTTEQAQ